MLILIVFVLIVFAFTKKLTWSRVVWTCASVDYLVTFLIANGQVNQPTLSLALLTTLVSGSLTLAISIALSWVLFRAKIQKVRDAAGAESQPATR